MSPDSTQGTHHVPLTEISGVGENKSVKLRNAGYENRRDIRKATESELKGVDGIGNALVQRMKVDVDRVVIDVDSPRTTDDYVDLGEVEIEIRAEAARDLIKAVWENEQ